MEKLARQPKPCPARAASVLAVAAHGMPDRGEVDADLVRAAGLERDAQQRRARERPLDLEMRPASRGRSVAVECAVRSRRSRPIGRVDRAAAGVRAAVDERQVLAPASRGARISSWSARWTASDFATTSRPEVSLSRRCTIPGRHDVVAAGGAALERLRQRAGLVARRRVHHDAGRLVDHSRCSSSKTTSYGHALARRAGIGRRRSPAAASIALAGPQRGGASAAAAPSTVTAPRRAAAAPPRASRPPGAWRAPRRAARRRARGRRPARSASSGCLLARGPSMTYSSPRMPSTMPRVRDVERRPQLGVDEVDHRAVARPVEPGSRAPRPRSPLPAATATGRRAQREVAEQAGERDEREERDRRPAAAERAEGDALVAHVRRCRPRRRRCDGRRARASARRAAS